MTSGIFRTIDPALVVIDRATRQRQELRGIPELAKSISEIGLIHPIVLTETNTLVAGERRLLAVRSLGWTSIPYQLASDLSELELRQIELEENVRRSDLTWQEHTKAVEDYHKLRCASETGWTQAKTAEALGVSQMNVFHRLEVAKAIASSPKIAAAPKFSVAKNMTERAKSRAKDSVLAPLQPSTKIYPGEILCADFMEFDYDGPSINFLHCDFPYGINLDRSDQAGTETHGTYSDSPDIFFALLARLGDFVREHTAESAHVMFWFSMSFYRETFDALTSFGFRVDPFPLIWHKSDNAGILPDKDRGPRRTYETAFIGSRGDRKIVSPVANSFSGSTSRDIHMSEKPEPMLRHFFRMFVDQTTVAFDPTCGSGTSIRAAENAGANRALGLEVNPEFARAAQAALRKGRMG